MTSCLSFAKSSRCEFVSKALYLFLSQRSGRLVFALQSVHWTLRILRYFQAFSSLRVFSAPKQNPCQFILKSCKPLDLLPEAGYVRSVSIFMCLNYSTSLTSLFLHNRAIPNMGIALLDKMNASTLTLLRILLRL